MGPDSDIDRENDSNQKKWELSRRKMLQMTGGAVAAGLTLAWLPKALRDEPVTEQSPDGFQENSPEPVTKRLRKWMMIIDLRWCDGCQSQDTPPQCTEACNFGHYLPDPMEWIEVYEHEIDPQLEKRLPNQVEEEISTSTKGTRFIPTPCMQCQNPPCVNVCPVGATWSTPEGPVLIDQDRCIGCRLCMAACPYERRFYSWGKAPIPPEAIFVEKSVEHQVPIQKGTVYKCDFCPEMARAGRLPFCAQACPQNAIYYGDLEEGIATNGQSVVDISVFLADNPSFRYKEEFGTRPRVFYISGNGELAGRDPNEKDRLPVRWPGSSEQEGAKHWKRSGR